MNEFSAIRIFRPGPHSRELTASALREAAAGYDPRAHEAPITIGHPTNDAPAHGWIGSLQFDESDSSLRAIPRQVSDGLKSVVSQGLFKHVSAAFYPPQSASNPTPGKWSLRHVGILGAMPPKVKGLGAVAFAEGETADDFLTVEFAEGTAPRPWVFANLGGILRGLRDWIISKDGLETANQVLPDYGIDSLQREAGRLEEAADSTRSTRRFSEPETIPTDPKEDEPVDPKDTDTFAEREADLAKRTAEIEAQEQALAARAAEADKAEAATFAEGLAGTGRILPRHAPTVAGLLGALPAEATVAFAEGDETPVQKPSREALKSFLESLPEQVNFSEVAPGGEDLPGNVTAIRAPDGFTVSDANADLDKKVREFAEKNSVDYATALATVNK